MSRKKTLLIALLFLIALSTQAQDGANDPSFNAEGIGANGKIYTSSIQNDGKIIIGGKFTSFNETERNRITRLNSDGTIDTTFNLGSGANSRVETTAIQSDGKIIIGGWFSSFNGTELNRIARLNSDGSVDDNFNPGSGANGVRIITTAIQSDGKIIIGGYFTSYNGTQSNYIARLNTDGSLDDSFNLGSAANDAVKTTTIQNDGKIIIGGNFTNFNGTDINRIARLNVDGSIDFSFNPGLGSNGVVRTTALQNDGKIIIGGYFTSYNGTQSNYIARLNTDGSLDDSFNLGSGANDGILTISIQNDGKIIIGGELTSYNETERNHIARLNADGSIDSSFNPGTGTNGPEEIGIWGNVNTTTMQNDGKIIIGGNFTSYNETVRGFLTRVLANTTVGIASNKIEDNLSIYPTPFSDKIMIEVNGNSKILNIEILNSIGQVVLSENFVGKIKIQTNHFAPGVYLVKVESISSKQSGKINIEIKKIIKE